MEPYFSGYVFLKTAELRLMEILLWFSSYMPESCTKPSPFGARALGEEPQMDKATRTPISKDLAK